MLEYLDYTTALKLYPDYAEQLKQYLGVSTPLFFLSVVIPWNIKIVRGFFGGITYERWLCKQFLIILDRIPESIRSLYILCDHIKDDYTRGVLRGVWMNVAKTYETIDCPEARQAVLHRL